MKNNIYILKKIFDNIGSYISSGERLIQFASDHLVTEVLIHPQLNTLQQCMKNMLGSFTKHRQIINGGYTFAGTGHWVLQVISRVFFVFNMCSLQETPTFIKWHFSSFH